MEASLADWGSVTWQLMHACMPVGGNRKRGRRIMICEASFSNSSHSQKVFWGFHYFNVKPVKWRTGFEIQISLERLQNQESLERMACVGAMTPFTKMWNVSKRAILSPVCKFHTGLFWQLWRRTARRLFLHLGVWDWPQPLGDRVENFVGSRYWFPPFLSVFPNRPGSENGKQNNYNHTWGQGGTDPAIPPLERGRPELYPP